jgi:hypothetical protein
MKDLCSDSITRFWLVVAIRGIWSGISQADDLLFMYHARDQAGLVQAICEPIQDDTTLHIPRIFFRQNCYCVLLQCEHLLDISGRLRSQ